MPFLRIRFQENLRKNKALLQIEKVLHSDPLHSKRNSSLDPASKQFTVLWRAFADAGARVLSTRTRGHYEESKQIPKTVSRDASVKQGVAVNLSMESSTQMTLPRVDSAARILTTL
jgi:hypothetical protein